MRIDDYQKYHGTIPGLPGGCFNAGLTDDVIDKLLESRKNDIDKHKEIAKKCYGNDFENVDEIESSPIDWSPFTSYLGVDPENEELLKKQVVEVEYDDGDDINFSYPSTTYIGITSWYDGFGYEIKRATIKTSSLEKLKEEFIKVKSGNVQGITRENGLISIPGDGMYFDTGAPVLPEYDREVGCVAYPTVRKGVIDDFNPTLSDEQEKWLEKIAETIKFRVKESPVKVDSTGIMDRDKILEQFDKNTEFTKKFEHPNWEEYITDKKKKLEEAIFLAKHTVPLKKEIEKLKEQNQELQCCLADSNAMLKKALNFAQIVRDSKVGKLFFGKKADKMLGEQKKNEKQLPEGR